MLSLSAPSRHSKMAGGLLHYPELRAAGRALVDLVSPVSHRGAKDRVDVRLPAARGLARVGVILVSAPLAGAPGGFCGSAALPRTLHDDVWYAPAPPFQIRRPP